MIDNIYACSCHIHKGHAPPSTPPPSTVNAMHPNYAASYQQLHLINPYNNPNNNPYNNLPVIPIPNNYDPHSKRAIQNLKQFPKDNNEHDFFVVKMKSKRNKYSSIHSNIEDSSEEDDDYVELRNNRHKRLLRNRTKKNLKYLDEGLIEGDVFQYEDFDFDQERLDNQKQYSSDSYEDFDYGENFNNSWFQANRERATPDGLISRHRRIYSKWSRWTKCSPKCTTRRYKYVI